MRPHINTSLMQSERGAALILAIIIIIVISATIPVITFMVNNNTATSNSYEDAQESFLASEACVSQVKNYFEQDITRVFASPLYTDTLGNSMDGVNVYLHSPTLTPGQHNIYPVCRTGNRDKTITAVFEDKTSAYDKNPIGFSVGHFTSRQFRIMTTGKGSRDKDKEDSDADINTGTEISYGFEIMVPTGGMGLTSY